ncbi:MAG: TRAP transporter substrate-binding protein, partial [Hyphomicrobiales bacterium]
MLKSLSTKLLGAAAALTMMAVSASAADWRAWNIHNEGHPNFGGMNKFAELVAKETSGEVKVQVFHGGV